MSTPSEVIKPPHAKGKPVCPKCGSDKVVADAAARWDTDTQEWDVSNVFDKGHSCDDCEATDIEFEWVPCEEADE